MTTTITTENALERARYVSTLFGRGASNRWHFDRFSLKTLAEQVAAGEIAEYTLDRLAEEIPPAWVAECIATPTQSQDVGCGGKGYHWVYDTDYPCSGCGGCKPERARIGWVVGAFFWALATGAERQRLEPGVIAMRALASIGRAIESALSPGAGVGAFCGAAQTEWEAVRKGRWYRVTSRRGNAAAHLGLEAEVVGIYENERRSRYNTWSYGSTTRVGLRPLGHQGQLIYVNANALSPIPTPETVIVARKSSYLLKAERDELRKYDGAKGDTAYVIDGPYKGKVGRVIWVGITQRGPKAGAHRVGINIGQTDPIWCDACDVSADKPALVGSELSILVEVAVHALCTVVRLGFDALGEEPAFAPAPTVKPKRKARSRRRHEWRSPE